MNKYNKGYIVNKMADFIEFRTALRDAGHTYSQESEILLYSMWRRQS